MPNPEIIIIVAMAQNRVIGTNNTIPWHIPEDLQNFKAITLNHAVIMGRKTWESIGQPLPQRTNIVVTHNDHFHAPGCHIATSLDTAIQYAANLHDKIFIIGGGQIYTNAIPLATSIQITLLHRKVKGTIFFPPLSQKIFTLNKEKQYQWSEPVTIQHFSRNK